jgi:hypothetical protein
LTDFLEIHERHLTAGFQDAHDFADGFAAALAIGNIVDCEIGDDGVKSSVGERKLPHIAIADFDAIGNAFEARILERGFAGVATLIDLRPEIDSDCVATREEFCGADQKEAVAATDVENAFVTAKPEPREQPVARAKLSVVTATHEQKRFDEENRARAHHRSGDRDERLNLSGARVSREEKSDDREGGPAEKKPTNDAGSIEPVVGLLRIHFRGAANGIIA